MYRPLLPALLSLCAALLLAPMRSHGQSAFTCPRMLSADIPPRSASMAGGASFARSVAKLVRGARDAQTARAVLRGDIPDFLRHLKPVELHA